MNRNLIAYPVVALIALGIGNTLGSTTAAAVPAPVTITKTVQGPTVTKTVTVTKEVTPAACTKALETADKSFTIMSGAMQAASDGFMAVTRGDVAGLTKAGQDVDAATNALDPATYNAAEAACLAKS